MAASGIQEIITLRKQLEERDAERNNAYDEVLLHYGGATYQDRKKKGFFPGIKSVVSSIFNAREDDPTDDLTSPINLTRPAILNKVAFMALVPSIRIPEPPDTHFKSEVEAVAPDSPEMPAEPVEEPKDPYELAMEFSDDLESVLYAIWKYSNITRRAWDLAWNLGAFGGSVLGVWPDMRNERPRIFTRSPQDFYPVLIDEDGHELAQAVWVDELDGYDIKAKYGIDKYLGQKDIKVTQYIDTEKMCVILDDKEFAPDHPVKHDLGFVPLVCVGNIGVPGSPWGDTDVREAIPVGKEINYHMKLIADMASAMVNPTIAIRDPLNVPEDIAIGRGGKFTMGPQGSVELLGPVTLPNAFWQVSQQLQQWYDLISDNPSQLRGDAGGAFLTGKGFNASLSPVTARMQTRLNLVLSAWEQVNRYTLMMWAHMPQVSKRITATGMKNKNYFHVSKEPKDFYIDGDIWTENEVVLTAQSFVDRQGAEVELIQLAQNEYISWDTVVENLPYVTNKKRERAKVDRDRKWKAEGFAIANQMAESPATANVDPGEPETTAYGLELGLVGETGPPPTPSAVAPEAAGGPTPLEASPDEMGGQDAMSVFEGVFSRIPKLLGGVWIGGQPMLDPDSVNGEDWSLTVWVENTQDKGTILQFVKKEFPELHGHIEFVEGPPSEDEPSVQVGTPTQAASPEEEALAGAMPDGAPEGMDPMALMGMMGG